MTTVDALLDCLASEAQQVEHFIDLLEAEATALTESDSADELMGTTQAKQAAAARLGELYARRSALVAELGGAGGDYAAMQDLAARHAELAPAWEQLLELSSQARSLNQRNGVLIDAHLRHTQMSLDLLRGISGLGNVYDASGRAQAMGVGKTIATG